MVGLYDVLGNVEIWVNKDDSNVFGIVGLHYDSKYPGIASGDMQAYLRGGESSDYFDSVDYITNRIIEDTFVGVLESSRYTIAGFRFVRSVDPNESKAVTDDYEDDDDTSYSESDDE
jgi:hypothetical protein